MKTILENYTITKDGKVYSNLSKKYLKTFIRNGYETITIKKKNYKIHRLVALTYLTKIEGKDFINHIDGNKLNNNLENLEWCTSKENTQHAIKLGLFKPIIPQKMFGGKNGMAKTIIQSKNGNIINIFASISDAIRYCKENNLGSGKSINKCLYENRKSSYGYEWYIS